MSVVSKYAQDSLSRNVRNGLPAILVYIFADGMVGTKKYLWSVFIKYSRDDA